MRHSPTRALLLWFTCFLSIVHFARAQIILSDPLLLSQPSLFTPSSAQNIAPQLSLLATHPDGSARFPIPFSFAHAANPFESAADFNLFSPDIRWRSGTYHPLDIDLELPSRGLSWPIGRTFNAHQNINNDHHVSHGPQGENWAQISMPELLPTDDTRIILIAWGADRISPFLRVDQASNASVTVFRGIQGSAGTIEHVHAEPDFFRFTDPRGFQAVFFGHQSTAARRLWYIADPAGRASFVGSMQSPQIAAAVGYGSDGLIDLAVDSAGRRYSYRYSNDPIGAARRLLEVTVTIENAIVATVTYDYYAQYLADAGRVGDLKTVSVSLPLSNPSEQVTYKKHYRYWTEPWSNANPGHPHLIRTIIEPEGFRRALIDGFDPDVVIDTQSLNRYASLRLEYDVSRRIAAWYDINLATSEAAGEVPSADRNTIAYETNIGPSHRDRTIINAAGHFTTLYFDRHGQQLSAIRSAVHPEQSDSFKVYEIARDEHGFVNYRGTPRAALGYQHASGDITRRIGGGLAVLLERIGAGEYRGFVSRVRVSDGGSQSTSQYELVYQGQQSSEQAISRRYESGYTMIRPMIEASTVFEDETAASPLTTSYAYRTFSTIEPGGSTLAVQSIAVTSPTVSRDRNGSGGMRISRSLLDHDGSQLAIMHHDGRIDAFVYDNQGLRISIIRDCDSSRIQLPPDFQTQAGVEALHRITSFGYDKQARPNFIEYPGMNASGPRRSEMYWSSLADGRLVKFETPQVGGGVYYGPIESTVFDHGGRAAATFVIGLPGADYTLDPASTTVPPSRWITEGRAGIESIVGPVGSTRAMLLTSQTDPTGTHLLRQDTYTLIPIALPGEEGVNFHALRSRFLRGIQVQTIDEAGTIDSMEIDSFGRSVSYSRTTQTSGRPPFTMARLNYDHGETSGNDDVTSVIRFGGSSADRITNYRRDWRGRVVSIRNSAAPHQIFRYDNLNRVTAVGLYGETSDLSSIVDPFAAHPKRRSLVSVHRDQAGQIYRTLEYDIDQVTGEIMTVSGSVQALETEQWHSPGGELIAWTGAMDGRRRFNRLGELTDEFVTVEADGMFVESAIAEPPSEIVLTHRKLVRHAQTGDVITEINAERSAAIPVGMAWFPCSSNPWPLIPPSFIGSNNGDALRFCNDANSGGFSHPMQVETFVYDPLGRPIQRTRWGDPAYSRTRGGEGCIPHGSRASPIDGTTRQMLGSFPDLDNGQELSAFDDVYPRTESLARNRFGLPSVIAAASGRAEVIEYDDALRPVSTSKRLVRSGPMFGGIGDIAFSACSNPPPVRREYDGMLLKALLPGPEQLACEQAKYENTYEPDPLIWADFMSDVPDASAPSILGAKPESGVNCSALTTDEWAVKRNGFGEVIKSRDPAGNVTDIVRDGAGRPMRMTISRPSGGVAVQREFVYDDVGRQIGVVQNDDLNGNTGTLRIYGPRAMLLNKTDYIEPRGTGDPLRGMPDSMTCYFNRVENRGWNRVERHKASFPGGIVERFSAAQCQESLDSLVGRNGVIEAFSGSVGCDFEGGFPILRMNIPYHGIADPAWFDVSPEPSMNLDGTTSLRRVSMYATPEDLGIVPTNEFEEPKRDLICAGAAGMCSVPLIDQELSRDPDGKLLDLRDHVIEDAGRRVFYMDCTNSLEQFEGLFARGYGESGGNLEDPEGATRQERVTYDDFGNVVIYEASRFGGVATETEIDVNGHNQVVHSPQAGMGPIEYDANGNLIRDGSGRRYEYDVENKLIRAFVETEGAERLFARYWYNAEGKRIAAAYNDNLEVGPQDDSVFENERVEHYAYDDLWRLRAVYVREPNAETAVWRERYIYDGSGMRGMPTSAKLDSPVAVQYNDDEDEEADRTSLILRNHMGDVIKLTHDDGTKTEIRYSLFGEPRSESFFADFNRDGAVDGDDVILFFELWDSGEADADIDGNGSVDGDDVITFFAWWDESRGVPDLSELRFGYRGYVWDARMGLYHVRHRVYDPRSTATGMRWLQRDPAFFVDGLNLYAYCAGDPVNGLDSMGLQSQPPTEDEEHERGYWENCVDGFKSIVPWPGMFDPAGIVSRWQTISQSSDQSRQRRNHVSVDPSSEGEQRLHAHAHARTVEDVTKLASATADAIDLMTRMALPIGDAVEGITEAGYRFYEEPTVGKAAAVVLFVIVEAGPGKNPLRVERRAGESVEEAVERAVRSAGGDAGLVIRKTRASVFEGKRVWERPHLIDMNRVDPDTGRTNRQRMKDGDAPVTDQGRIHLHHIDQRTDTPLLWITEKDHIKVEHPRSPSEIDRREFDRFRERYWKQYERSHQ